MGTQLLPHEKNQARQTDSPSMLTEYATTDPLNRFAIDLLSVNTRKVHTSTPHNSLKQGDCVSHGSIMESRP
ncbi:hypothetical protein PCANC_03992 [Puccinia coronata f. sp. avenae]|uniref:Uncharacterized protein n=1 Tax=Puccinia coronata f. sp. avenae TaxID=200324 RepID=A0A2N5T7Y1_9BASI|nr:hypothetical protein PCANC_03992 [Puccinia coronata f. sp. avenae]